MKSRRDAPSPRPPRRKGRGTAVPKPPAEPAAGTAEAAAPGSESEPTLGIRCPCTYQDVRAATRTIRTFLEQQGLGRTEVEGWELVAVEAGNNAVKHASRPMSHRPVGFDVQVTRDHVELRVTDHTAGFDLPPIATLPDPRSEHGRGLFLMRMLSDELRYLRRAGGNCLVVRKRRGPVQPVTAA